MEMTIKCHLIQLAPLGPLPHVCCNPEWKSGKKIYLWLISRWMSEYWVLNESVRGVVWGSPSQRLVRILQEKRVWNFLPTMRFPSHINHTPSSYKRQNSLESLWIKIQGTSSSWLINTQCHENSTKQKLTKVAWIYCPSVESFIGKPNRMAELLQLITSWHTSHVTRTLLNEA